MKKIKIEINMTNQKFFQKIFDSFNRKLWNELWDKFNWQPKFNTSVLKMLDFMFMFMLKENK